MGITGPVLVAVNALLFVTRLNFQAVLSDRHPRAAQSAATEGCTARNAQQALWQNAQMSRKGAQSWSKFLPAQPIPKGLTPSRAKNMLLSSRPLGWAGKSIDGGKGAGRWLLADCPIHPSLGGGRPLQLKRRSERLCGRWKWVKGQKNG